MMLVMFFLRMACMIRGRHRPEWALDPFSGYYTVCQQCGDRRLRVEFDP